MSESNEKTSEQVAEQTIGESMVDYDKVSFFYCFTLFTHRIVKSLNSQISQIC